MEENATTTRSRRARLAVLAGSLALASVALAGCGGGGKSTAAYANQTVTGGVPITSLRPSRTTAAPVSTKAAAPVVSAASLIACFNGSSSTPTVYPTADAIGLDSNLASAAKRQGGGAFELDAFPTGSGSAFYVFPSAQAAQEALGALVNGLLLTTLPHEQAADIGPSLDEMTVRGNVVVVGIPATLSAAAAALLHTCFGDTPAQPLAAVAPDAAALAAARDQLARAWTAIPHDRELGSTLTITDATTGPTLAAAHPGTLVTDLPGERMWVSAAGKTDTARWDADRSVLQVSGS